MAQAGLSRVMCPDEGGWIVGWGGEVSVCYLYPKLKVVPKVLEP